MKCRWTALQLCALIVWIALGTSKEQAVAQSGSPQGDSNHVRQVLYDHLRPDKPPLLKVQVLVDTSASMKGFRKNLPGLLHAVDEGLSYSRDLYFSIQSKKACFFDQKRGIFDCQPRVDGVQVPEASGYTNLDRAVKSAGDYGLSVIFTDGVPSGLSSGKECVGSGVDAACVSDALSSVLRGASGTDASLLRGAWIVPIVTMYEGIFFAEQPINPGDFQASVAEAKIREDLGVNARIDNPRKGNDGTLIFDYQGPRILLALVVGEVAPSRAFLQEFVNHTNFSLLSTLSEAKSYKGGTAILPVVEVFPSTVPPEQYQVCQETKDQRGRIEGDLVNCAVSSANDFRLSCLPKPSSAHLQLSTKDPNRPLRLDLLAPANLSFSGHGTIQKVTLAGGSAGGSPSRLTIQIACNGKQPVHCGTPEARSELTSTGDMQAAVNELSSPVSVLGNYIQKLATTQPAVEPHKIYGLADLLENFYRRNLPESKSVFATLQFCQE
ncbi:MAG: hypothetical protein LAO20_18580 [Acidobacteriia bacterium]|nr:hypothetical protein [Terriglobia bacterium]